MALRHVVSVRGVVWSRKVRREIVLFTKVGEVRETDNGQGKWHFRTVGQGTFSFLIILKYLIFLVYNESSPFSMFYF